MSDFEYDPLSPDDEFTQRRKRSEQLVREMRAQGIRPGETRPALPSYSDQELLVEIADRDGRPDLIRRLALDPATVVAEHGREIERERLTRATRDRQQIEAERSRSPEGRALAAAEALDAQARDAQRVEAARALIAADPAAHGVSEAMIPDLTPAEALALSGLVQTTDPTTDPAANVAAAEGSDAA